LTMLIAFGFSACTSQGQTGSNQPPGGGDQNLTGVEWRFTGFTYEGAETPVVPGSTVTLQFSAGGQVEGSAGCNAYGGEYQVDGSQIRVGSLFQTKKACLANGLMEQESWFINALENAHEFEITGDQLNIFYRDGLGTLHFVAGN
jgi:heat shock protein HslJ